MNLLAKKTGLLIMLGALFFLSCKDANEILLDPGDEANKIQTSLIDTFSISNTTVTMDPDAFRTASNRSSFPLLLFGNYTDPYLGNIRAYSFAEIGGGSFAKIDTVVELISFKLLLDLEYQQGDKSLDQEINIYRLNDTINRTPFNNDDYVNTSVGPNVGEIINTKKSFNFSRDVIPNKKKIEIDLDNGLGSQFLESIKQGPDSLFSKQSNFRKFFNGIRVEGGINNTAVFGALTNGDSSAIVLKYRRGTKIVDLTFPILFNVNNVSKPQVPLIANTSIVQSSTGIFGKISFPSVKNLKQFGNRIAINRAELIMEPEIENNISPPANLFLILTRGDSLLTKTDTRISYKNYKVVQSSTSIISEYQSENLNPLNVRFDSNSKSYRANVTTYIEALLKDNSDYYTTDLVIYPESFANTAVNNRFSYTISSNGVFAADKDLTLNKAVIQNQKIKLKIYYTLVD